MEELINPISVKQLLLIMGIKDNKTPAIPKRKIDSNSYTIEFPTSFFPRQWSLERKQKKSMFQWSSHVLSRNKARCTKKFQQFRAAARPREMTLLSIASQPGVLTRTKFRPVASPGQRFSSIFFIRFTHLTFYSFTFLTAYLPSGANVRVGEYGWKIAQASAG